MENNRARRTLLKQDVDDIFMRIAIVDDQRFAQALGKVDVEAEGALLRNMTRCICAVVVQPRFADSVYARGRGKLLDLGQGSVQRGLTLTLDESRRIVGMDGYTSNDGTVLLNEVHRPTRRRQIAANLHHSGHADGCGLLKGGNGIGLDITVQAAIVDVKVAMCINHWVEQRLRQLRRTPACTSHLGLVFKSREQRITLGHTRTRRKLPPDRYPVDGLFPDRTKGDIRTKLLPEP